MNDLMAIFRKDDPAKSENFRPMNVLPTVSKVFERIMHKHMSIFVERFLSSYICRLKKGFSTQQA